MSDKMPPERVYVHKLVDSVTGLKESWEYVGAPEGRTVEESAERVEEKLSQGIAPDEFVEVSESYTYELTDTQ